MSVNLFTALFYLLLFLLMCGTLLCGQVCATSGDKLSSDAKKEYELFKEKKESITFESTGVKAAAEEVVVDDYYSPALVSAGDVLVGLAGVNRTKASEENITILAKYVESDKLFKGEGDLGTEGDLQSQFAFKHKAASKMTGDIIKGLLAVTKESKIYLLLVNYTTKAVGSLISHEWTFNLFVGDATGGIREEKVIDWKKKKIRWLFQRLINLTIF